MSTNTKQSALTPAQAMRRAREIRAEWDTLDITPLKLGVLATFSAEFLAPYIVIESDEAIPVKPWFGAFGQLEQLLLDDRSELWTEQPGALWIALRLEDVDPEFVFECRTLLTPENKEARLERLVARVVRCAEVARTQMRGPVFVSNFSLPRSLSAGIFDASDPNGAVFAVMDANRHLAKRTSTMADVFVFDYAGTVADSGAIDWCDPKLWHLAKIPCASKNQKHFACRLSQTIAQTLRPSAKCLVLDLDNTLWGGVIGDDGTEGIALGDDYPGSVFKEFQKLFLSFQRQGILLAIASKNDESTVLDCLQKHPDMVLRQNHFSSIKANWGPKSESIKAIAKELNLGLDSFIFVDDNPVERAHIRSALPEVEVVELPSQPLDYFDAIRNLTRLQKPRLLNEDANRATMYANEARRTRVANDANSIEEFLESLQMTAQVGTVRNETLGRVHQLISKTNQFNLTTIRHSFEDVRLMSSQENCAVCWLRLKDSFGDLGLVCVGIVRIDDHQVGIIDSLLMSCRVMGRNVEQAFLSYLIATARSRGAKEIHGQYIPTIKNKPTRNLYPSMGFTPLLESHHGQNTFLLKEDTSIEWPQHIARQVTGDEE